VLTVVQCQQVRFALKGPHSKDGLSNARSASLVVEQLAKGYPRGVDDFILRRRNANAFSATKGL
jgi:hypothetical protein